jgi:hypothetical protein
MRVDPALQGKSSVGVNASSIGGSNAIIGLVSISPQNGGLRSFRAMLNPGVVDDAKKEAIKNTMKRTILREWNRNKKPGDIITGDAQGYQDPINTVSDLNL